MSFVLKIKNKVMKASAWMPTGTRVARKAERDEVFSEEFVELPAPDDYLISNCSTCRGKLNAYHRKGATNAVKHASMVLEKEYSLSSTTMGGESSMYSVRK